MPLTTPMRLAFAPPQTAPRGDVLVVVFLRGAADGLNMIVPHGEEAYYRARPTLHIPRPDQPGGALDLDGFFGLHPALAALQPAWHNGTLGVVHACGAPDESRSHFRAMALMERGVDDERGPASGWIGRHLASLNTGNASPLRAISLSHLVPLSLSGGVPVTALQSITDFHLGGDAHQAEALRAALQALYAEPTPLGQLGRDTLAIARVLHTLDPARYTPKARYPDSDFGRGLRQAAMLIKAEVGLEVAALDVGGWDTHVAQGGADGLMARLLRDLGDGLGAFHADMRDHWARLTVVVMSEFGRRVAENASLGTDHGHGGALMVLSGHVQGRCVHGRWPGLHPDLLVGPGDLAVTTDYRDVLAEICAHRLNNPALAEIFPGYTPRWHGVCRPG